MKDISNSVKPRKTLLHTRKTLVNRKTFERLNYLVKDTQIISGKTFLANKNSYPEAALH